MIAPAPVPAGVLSLSGVAARRQQHAERQCLDLLLERGFELVYLPVLEYAAPGARGGYRFVDPTGRVVAVRTDFTPERPASSITVTDPSGLIALVGSVVSTQRGSPSLATSRKRPSWVKVTESGKAPTGTTSISRRLRVSRMATTPGSVTGLAAMAIASRPLETATLWRSAPYLEISMVPASFRSSRSRASSTSTRTSAPLVTNMRRDKGS